MYHNVHTTFNQITCSIKQDYNGSNCPVRFGLMTCLCAPRCDEGKIPVAKDDIVTVTRWQRRWVYGDKKLTKGITIIIVSGRRGGRERGNGKGGSEGRNK